MLRSKTGGPSFLEARYVLILLRESQKSIPSETKCRARPPGATAEQGLGVGMVSLSITSLLEGSRLEFTYTWSVPRAPLDIISKLCGCYAIASSRQDFLLLDVTVPLSYLWPGAFISHLTFLFANTLICFSTFALSRRWLVGN